MATIAVSVRCEGCSCNITYRNSSGTSVSVNCSNNSSKTVYANTSYNVTLSQIYSASGYTTPIKFYYNRSNGSGYDGSETLSGTSRTISDLSFGRTLKLVATSSGGSTITANLKCGDGIKSYRVNNSSGSQVAKITSKSSYTTLTLTKGDYYELGNIVYEDGWSGIKWWYNTSGNSYPNTSTTNPDYQLGSNYNRWGYFEATTYTAPVTYYDCYAYRGTGISSATVNYSSSVTVESGSSVTYRASVNSGYTWLGWYDANDNLISSNQTYTISSVKKNYYLTARAKKVSNYYCRAYAGTGIDSAYCNGYTSTQTIAEGSRATFTCTVSTGYTFKGWYDDSGDLISSNQTYQPYVYQSYYLTAKAEANTYYCQVSAGTGISSATVNGYTYGVSIAYGGTAQYRCTVTNGYVWDGWYEDDMKLSSKQALDLTIHVARNLQARATRAYYDCYAYKGNGISSATVNYSSSTNVEYGTKVTYRCSLSSGYSFLGWYDADDNLISSNQTYSVYIYKNTYLTARAQINTYKCQAYKGTGIASAYCNGYTTVRTVDSGTQVTFTCTLSPNYSFLGWYDADDNLISSSQTYKPYVYKNYYLTARAERKEWVCRAVAGIGISAATVNDESSVRVLNGNTAKYRCSVRIGYTWDGWYEDDMKLSSTQALNLTIYTARTLEAVATLNSYTCQAYKGTGIQNATVNGYTTAQTVNYGSTATFVATVATGYNWLGWYDADDNLISSSQTYKPTVTKNLYLTARAGIKQFNCKATAGDGTSSATINNYYTELNVDYGASVTFRCSVNTGYTFDGWYSGSTRVSTSQTYTVSSVTGNQQLTSKATLNRYVVRASAGTGISAATVNDSSSITLNYGDTAQFRCSVRTGYRWDGWYSGSSRITTTQNYDWTVTSARTLEARATLIPHTAYAYSTGFGCCFSSVSVNKSSFVSGDSLTFTANLNTGYVFRGWYNSSGTRVSTNRVYTFTAGDSDYTLYARADFAWTYDKQSGSSTISAEEFIRLQQYITQRNGASFSTQPTRGEKMSAKYYNLLKDAIGSGSTVIKGQAIAAALLNALRDNANNL